MTDDIQHKQELLDVYKRRLYQRELQVARLGIAADPAIMIDLEDIKGEIARLENEITQVPTTKTPDKGDSINQRVDTLEDMLIRLQQTMNSRQKEEASKRAQETNVINTKSLRKLLMQFFTDEDIKVFCYDNYRPVYDQFSANTSKIMMIQDLIEYCDRRNELKQLYDLIKEERPNI